MVYWIVIPLGSGDPRDREFNTRFEHDSLQWALHQLSPAVTLPLVHRRQTETSKLHYPQGDVPAGRLSPHASAV